MIRTFFAIDIPQDIQESINSIIQLLKTNDQIKVKWSKLHKLHITLQFLKELSLADIPALMENVRHELSGIPSFEIELGPPGLFPDNVRPHVISMAPLSDDRLNQLSKRIGQGILATHYPIETRIYRPHLTLGHVIEAPPESFSFEKIKLPHKLKFLVNEIVYYQSSPSKNGSYYTPLARIDI